jgi:nonribosomal peptide synthetase DhbF
VYRPWAQRLPDWIEVRAIQLPGRQDRYVEPAATSVADLTDPLLRALEPDLALGPYAFFGHSMGALIAFELARELHRRGARLPVRVAISAWPAPFEPRPFTSVGSLTDREFLAAVRELGGVPAEVLAAEDLLAFVLPALRADFALCEAYRYLSGPAVPVPLSIFGGTADPFTADADLGAWRRETTHGIMLRRYPGDHFYLVGRQHEVMTDLVGDLVGDLAVDAGGPPTAVTATTAVPATSLADWFGARARACPAGVAIDDGERRVSYGDLDLAAGTVTAALTAAGVRPGTLVGLRMTRRWEVAAAMLGIWRSGCAYVPIDPEHPEHRQQYVLRDAGIGVVVTGDGTEILCDGNGHPVDLPPDAAYVIYTSGSTGAPKGVVVTHRNLMALFAGALPLFDIGPDDVWSVFHSHTFDFSVWELWGALLTGARCLLVPQAVTRDPAALADLLAERGVSVLSQVPSVFRSLVHEVCESPRKFPRLRYVVFGGEAIDPAVLLRWRRLSAAPDAELVNMYGITEITVHATIHRLEESDLTRLSGGTPIGVALPHLRIRLVEDGEPVPAGTPGEIQLSGDAVAWGYVGRPELTAERFLTDRDGPRWYRSGDYGLLRADGVLEYLGRRDDQVKIRGFRIELGEIEAALSAVPGVRECAVVRVTNARGDGALVACYVPEGDDAPDPGALQARLAERLPAQMIPRRYLALERLPLTTSGKLDRLAMSSLASS